MTDTPSPQRLRSVDYVRGLACVLMAIDHVRVYSGIPAGGPTPGIFLTRWVTHFVAPAFALLAGTSAYYFGKRHGIAALRRFLVSRGFLLVLMELTVIRFLWAAHWNPAEFTLAGVIWMLGWCMVLLTLFVGLAPRTAAIAGLAIVGLQQVFGLFAQLLPDGARAWLAFVYPNGVDPALGVNVLYVLVPWIGVMICGYAVGAILDRPDAERRRWLTRTGGAMTIGFVVIAVAFALVTKGGDDERSLWMRVLDQQKYPASPLFLLMTLGPALWLMPFAERARGRVSDALVTFGRVPMFYYLAHLVAIHAAALLVNRVRTGAMHGDWYTTAPYTGIPDEGRWNLAVLYVVWALVVVVVLYPACRWYDRTKSARPGSWLRYL